VWSVPEVFGRRSRTGIFGKTTKTGKGKPFTLLLKESRFALFNNSPAEGKPFCPV